MLALIIHDNEFQMGRLNNFTFFIFSIDFMILKGKGKVVPVL